MDLLHDFGEGFSHTDTAKLETAAGKPADGDPHLSWFV